MLELDIFSKNNDKLNLYEVISAWPSFLIFDDFQPYKDVSYKKSVYWGSAIQS